MDESQEKEEQQTSEPIIQPIIDLGSSLIQTDKGTIYQKIDLADLPSWCRKAPAHLCWPQAASVALLADPEINNHIAYTYD